MTRAWRTRPPSKDCRPAPVSWWFAAVRTPAAGFCSMPTSPPRAGIQRATSSLTTSRSRGRCQPERLPDGFFVRDVGSLNGTYVNRERIDDSALQGSDEVQIGKFRLVFLTGHRPGDAAAQ